MTHRLSVDRKVGRHSPCRFQTHLHFACLTLAHHRFVSILHEASRSHPHCGLGEGHLACNVRQQLTDRGDTTLSKFSCRELSTGYYFMENSPEKSLYLSGRVFLRVGESASGKRRKRVKTDQGLGCVTYLTGSLIQGRKTLACEL